MTTDPKKPAESIKSPNGEQQPASKKDLERAEKEADQFEGGASESQD